MTKLVIKNENNNLSLDVQDDAGASLKYKFKSDPIWAVAGYSYLSDTVGIKSSFKTKATISASAPVSVLGKKTEKDKDGNDVTVEDAVIEDVHCHAELEIVTV